MTRSLAPQKTGYGELLHCFHPSAEGQAKLSAETWAVGPFATP